MLKATSLIAVAMLVLNTPAALSQNTAPNAGATPAERLVCKHVVSAEPGSKPRPLCMTKIQWAAKQRADAKNVNRIVCRYDQNSRSKFETFKICMTAAEWENQRQLERQQVERIQSSTCVAGAGC